MQQLVYCQVFACSVKLQAHTAVIFHPGYTGINSGLEAEAVEQKEQLKIQTWEGAMFLLRGKRLPSTNPSSSSPRLRLSWAMKRSAQSHSLSIPGSGGPVGFGHPKHSDLLQRTAPAFSVSFQCFLSPTSPGPVRKPQARTSLGLAYGKDTFTAGPSLNASFSQYCAAYGHNS